MRVLVGSFLIMTAGGVVLLQSSRNLHSRYGEPDRERFAARPGVSLTVEYGSDRLVCYALIDPPQPLLYSEEQVPLMPSDEVTEVLEEVAPVAMRGKEVNAALTVSGCNQFRLTDYENVSIMRSTHTCDPSSHAQDIRTAVTFKRDVCPKQRK